MRAKRTTLVSIVSLLLAATQVLAHHSFVAQYDESKPVALSGTIAKVMWKNPHVDVMLNVKDDSGNAMTWNLELGSPSILMKQGWKVDSLKSGDQITVTGFAAKDGSPILNARKITVVGR